jgi:hypothetical protein
VSNGGIVILSFDFDTTVETKNLKLISKTIEYYRNSIYEWTGSGLNPACADLISILVGYIINNMLSIQYLHVYLQKINHLSNNCQYPYYFPYCLLWYE